MDNKSFLSSNTTLAPLILKWTPSITSQAIVLVISLISNIVVFCEFLRVPSRITPFTTYLLVLLGTNIFFLSVVPLTELFNQLYGRWWMGRALCHLHNYVNGVMSGSQICIHVTISINRLWAVHYPISYRTYHDKRTALLTCLAAVAFAHVVGMPGFVMDILYYSIDFSKYGCHINYTAQVLWGKFENALLHMLPLVLIIVAYIHLCVNRVRRRRKLADQSSMGARKTRTAGNADVTDKPSRKEAVKPFLVLSLTAISVTICWTPAVVYYAVIKFFGSWMPATFFSVAVTMYSMQALFDPWLLAFCLLTAEFKWNAIRHWFRL